MSPVRRCEWAGAAPVMIDYHDKEWGTPQHDDRVLFEFLILEGAQAGLSWATILKKRDNYRRLRDLPAQTEVSEELSKDLRDRGFRFVGPTICYAFMQAVGMVNDHVIDCFRYRELA